MANEVLVTAVKGIVSRAREGKLDEAYAGYRDLFGSEAFRAYEPADQRQALKIMIHARGAPNPPSAPMIEAHRTAIEPLTQLVSMHSEPADYEMLGMCQILVGNEPSAASLFRAGLAIERERSAGSDLCGALMKRISML